MKILKSVDWQLLCPALVLTTIGLLSIYSSSVSRGNFLDFKKQFVYFAVSLLFFFLILRIDLRFLKINSYFVLAVYLIFLVLLVGLFFIAPLTRGIRGWYKLGPVSFDPEPLAAVSLIILLSKYFSFRHTEIKSAKPILASAVYALAPFLLIFFQPDFGSAVCFGAIWFGIIIFSGTRLKQLLIIFLILVLLAGFSWQFLLKDYQKVRVLSFLNPDFDPKGASWSVNQSRIAIGSAGFWGKGLTKGPQTQYGFLTEPKTDFIFSAWIEETGFLGALALFGALFFLFRQIIGLAFLQKSNFSRLFAAGFAFFFLTQATINIAMCLGLLPVIGIPLPLVSYGGNQLLAFYIGLGILNSLELRG